MLLSRREKKRLREHQRSLSDKASGLAALGAGVERITVTSSDVHPDYGI